MLLKIQSPLKFIRQKSTPSLPQAVQLTTDPRSLFFTYGASFSSLFGSMSKRVDTTTVLGQLQALQLCAPVSGAIGKIQESARNARWVIEDKEGNESTKANALTKIMERPNVMQTWEDFIANIIAFVKAHGWAIVLPARAAGMTGVDSVYSLMVCPNWMIEEVKYTGKWQGQNKITDVIEYFRIGQTKITPDQVIIFTDSTISTSNTGMSFLLPQSRMYPLSDQVSNIIQAYQARYVLMAKKGALGILSNETKDAIGGVPLDAKEKKAVQDQFAAEYGLSADQSQVIITAASLKWQSMTFPTKDLMLFEEIKDSALMVYDAFGVPIFLTPFADQTTFTNLNAAEKRFYTTTVIPCVESIGNTIASFFGMTELNLTLKVYFDHLEIFQKSKKEEAEALKAFTDALGQPFVQGVITREEYRAILSNAMPEGVPFDAEAINGQTFYRQNANDQNQPPQ